MENAIDKKRIGLEVVLDAVTGLVVAVIAAVVIAIGTIHSLLAFALFGSALLFAAGVLRTSSTSFGVWLKGITVNLGVWAPVLLVKLFAQFYIEWSTLFLYLIPMMLFSVAGAKCKRLVLDGRRYTSFAAGVSCVGIVVVLTTVVAPRLLHHLTDKKLNIPEPSFAFSPLEGGRVTDTSLRGQVVLLDYWGTWCAPCLAEMPMLRSVQEHYRANSHVAIWAINTGRSGDDEEKVRTFSKSKNLALPIAMDTEKSIDKFGQSALPVLILIDKRGRIRSIHTGYDSSSQGERDLIQQVNNLLKE